MRFPVIKRVFRTFSTREKIALLGLSALLIFNLGLLVRGFYISKTHEVPALGGTYKEGMVGEPRFINPLLAQSQTDKDLSTLVYSGLYKLGPDGALIPDLAQSPLQVSEDGKQYTAVLKENIKWHDGTQLTVDDIIFTIEAVKNADFRSPLRRIWLGIEVQKVDDRTVKFINKDVSAPFVDNLTLGIMPRHIWSSVGSTNFATSRFNLEPVGSGPYFIREIKKTTRGELKTITLESYSNYINGKPYIDRVIAYFYRTPEDMVLALRTKNVNGIGYRPFSPERSLSSRRRNVQTLEIPERQYQAVFFNLSRLEKVLGDRRVRQALTQATNRTELIDDAFDGQGEPAYGPILPGQLGYTEDHKQAQSYNLEQANALLDEAGWVKDPNSGMRSKGGQALKFTLTTNEFSLNTKAAEELKEQWARVGVDIAVQIVPTAELERTVIQPRNFEALVFSESTGDDPDPFAFWHSSQSKSPGLNVAQYNNQVVDKLITDARSTFDQNARAESYKEFQRYITTDLPAIFLQQSVFIYHVPKNIKGVKIQNLASPEDRFYDLPNWYMDTKRKWGKE